MPKQPPIPPENRSPHEHKHDQHDTGNASVTGEEPKNPDKHGQQANTKQNTTHQGYQQDR
jgi:hypothetical protein